MLAKLWVVLVVKSISNIHKTGEPSVTDKQYAGEIFNFASRKIIKKNKIKFNYARVQYCAEFQIDF